MNPDIQSDCSTFRVRSSKFSIQALIELLPVVAGLLLLAAFPPFTASQVAWFGLVPLVFAVDHGDWRTAFRRGYLAGLVFFGATVWWTIHVTVIGTIALIAALAVYFGLGALWFWWVVRVLGLERTDRPADNRTARQEPRPPHDQQWPSCWEGEAPAEPRRDSVVRPDRRGSPDSAPPRSDSVLHNLLLMLLAPVGWVVLEWVRGRFILGGFPWNFVGVSQHAVPHAIQYAAVTGVYGVSALVAFGNLGIYCTARRFWNQLRTVAPRRRLSWEFYLAVGAMCLPLVYGARTIHRAAPAGESLRLLLVQGNIPQDLKFDPLEKSMILDRYERWTRAGLEFRRPDLIIWPETATPEALRYDPASYALVTNLAATAGVPLLSGTIDYTPRSEPPEGFNAAMLVGPDGAVQQIYRKLHLVPFGEYVPLRKIFPFLKWLTPIPDSFERGEQHTVFTLPASDRNAHPALRFGVVICFEDAVASLYRQFVRQDVDFMVNLTNDAWFKESPAAELHLANAVFRAVESRRPLVRVTNNGVTCIVDQFGIVRNRLDPFREGSLNTELALPATRPTTFYTRYGDVFVGGCALVGALAVAWGWQVRRRTP